MAVPGPPNLLLNVGEVTIVLSAAQAGAVDGGVYQLPKATPSNGRALSWACLPDAAVTLVLRGSHNGIDWFTLDTMAAVAVYTINTLANICVPYVMINQTVHLTAGQVTASIYT